IVESRCHAIEPRAGQFHRGDGVGEAGLVLAARDRLDFCLVLGNRGVERRPEMLGRDLGKRRRLEWRSPRFKQRIFVVCHATFSTTLATTRFSPAFSNLTVSLSPSTSRTLP